MKYVKRNVLIASIVILGLCLMNTTVLAEPTVDSVSTEPTNPTHQAAITVTAAITGEDITSVKILVGECDSRTGVCFIWSTHDMEQNGNGDWVATATLEDTSGVSNYISYKFEIVDGGTQYNLTDESWEIDITIESDNGDNGDDDNGSPGFEIIVFLAAIAISVILLKRKRS